MRKYSRNEIIIAIIFTVVLISFVAYKIISNNKNLEKETAYINSKYSEIHYKDSINGVILETYYPEKWRASNIFHNFTLTNGDCYQIHFKEDVLNGEYDLSNALHKGARIIKKRNSDKVKIFYLDKEYQFKIDVIGDNN